jgi:thymidylate synthase (FAD)
MKIINPSFVIEDQIDGKAVLRKLEVAGRTCYKSEDLITDESAERFVRGILQRGHESVIEHVSVTVRIICDRGVTHEIVRHRIAGYSQESTRYCNYCKDKFGNEITVISPCFWQPDSPAHQSWAVAMFHAERLYFDLLSKGATPQEARSVLPNSLKTEIVMTANLREWRHFFKLRTSKAAHPQMLEIAVPMLAEFQRLIPVIFEDINPEKS